MRPAARRAARIHVNLRFWFVLLALALAAAASGWLARRLTPPVTPRPAAPSHSPDYYFTNATIITLDAHGQPEARLSTPRAVHHPDDDSVEVFAPRGRYFTRQGAPWRVRADHGLLPAGGKLVNLDGHVRIERPGSGGGPPLAILTDKITINLDTEVASTAEPVEIIEGRNRMSGVGMQAWLKDDRLILQADVRGVYVPKP